ncbi:AraC family transcriptional regulator [Sphingomonadaceae bacterium OTU29THOMA1]|nr:AraC family transcriptional regulator [Sphingomonadaceae bacterium OTU29THOMA1]
MKNLTRLNHSPDLSNRSRDWMGIVADLHWWHGPGEAMSLAPDHDIVAMRVAGTTPLTQRRDGKVDERSVAYGNVTVHPHGLDSHWSWTKPGAIMLMRFPPQLIGEVHRQTGDTWDLPNRFGFRDAAIEHYIRLLDLELHGPDGPAKALRWQSLSLAVASHIVEHVAGRDVAAPPSRGLSPRVLRRVVDHIGDHWQRPLALQELAEVAGVSRAHFARMFKLSTGRTVMDYVELTRLDRARALIVKGDNGLAQVAQLTGFVDQSHFARRFRRAFNQTPGEFARSYAAG